MKRFRFSLQALWTLRQRKEQTALECYGRALRQHHLALDRVRQADLDLADAWNTQSRRLQAPGPAALIVSHQTQCVALQERRHRAQADANAAEHQLHQSHQALLEAQRDRKVVERLRERRQADFARESNRADHRFLDELALRKLRPTLEVRAP